MSRFIASPIVKHPCCYRATVRDTSRPSSWSIDCELVCECYEIEDAERIALALNRLAQQEEVEFKE